ncbi:MAG: sulfur oxidation c-type cytochrome SoxA [Pseudomonadota bacterium]
MDKSHISTWSFFLTSLCVGFIVLCVGVFYETAYSDAVKKTILPTPKEPEKKVIIKPKSKDHPFQELLSGEDFLESDLKAMQNSPGQNPAQLWYEEGRTLWNTKEGAEEKSCATCHNKAEVSMKGIGFRYPAYNEAEKKVITLEDRINLCRQKFMKAAPLATETDNFLALSMYVRGQSSGLPLKIKTKGPAKVYFNLGKKLYYTKRGKKEHSCASCHEKNLGEIYQGTKLSQGHINGYPAYSISEKRPISALKRINACNTLSGSEHFHYGSKEHLALELYLTWRGEGLPVKTPALRK